jgi:hypothetical protein
MTASRELFFYTTSILRLAERVSASSPGEAPFLRKNIDYHLSSVGEYMAARDLATTLTPGSLAGLAIEASEMIPRMTAISHSWDGSDKVEANNLWGAACLLIARVDAAM